MPSHKAKQHASARDDACRAWHRKKKTLAKHLGATESGVYQKRTDTLGDHKQRYPESRYMGTPRHCLVVAISRPCKRRSYVGVRLGGVAGVRAHCRCLCVAPGFDKLLAPKPCLSSATNDDRPKSENPPRIHTVFLDRQTSSSRRIAVSLRGRLLPRAAFSRRNIGSFGLSLGRCAYPRWGKGARYRRNTSAATTQCGMLCTYNLIQKLIQAKYIPGINIPVRN